MIERLLDKEIRRLAEKYPVISVTGPRQSGKTTLCRTTFKNFAYVNLEDLDTRTFAIEDPRGFLAGLKPGGAILDEIQRAPNLPSYLQGIVDEKKNPGMFVLTGSQQFEVMNTIRQSLAGRTAIVRLLPFAYEEIYRSVAPSSFSEMLYRGFYPRIHDQNLNPTEALSFYTSTYLERDLQSFLQVRDLGTFERFLRLCAAYTGQLVNHSKLGSDCGIDQKTAQAWLSILEASYIVYFLSPYSRNFRKRIVKSPKLYFYDVGLASYLLNISSPLHLENHPLKGALFENFVVTEFLKNRFNHIQENNLFFFRDHAGHEVDLVLDYGNEIQSVEIKAGQTIASDYFKGFEFFAELAKTKNQTSYFVYAGTESRVQKGIRIFSYQTLPKLFEETRNSSEFR